MQSGHHKVIKAYKYVDLEHADAVARGSLKIGTLAGYAELEGPRADEADGALSRTFGDWTCSEEDAQIIDKVGALPFSVAPGASIKGIEFIEQTPPVFCFCASRKRNDRVMMAEKKQAVFEISDFMRFCIEIFKGSPRKFRSLEINFVEYRSRRVSAHLDLSSRANPFIKDSSYSNENEIRAVLEPKPLAEVETFITNPSWFVQRFISRVG